MNCGSSASFLNSWAFKHPDREIDRVKTIINSTFIISLLHYIIREDCKDNAFRASI
jgi:hypothetical protein